MTIYEKLAAEFPRGDIHWRAQNISQDGTSALALAYLDARDVMNRLDEVCGPDGWQDSYVETPRGRVICTLSILCPLVTGMQNIPDWRSKSDGAGETDIEGEKGALSDAFKRAAVKWGIGRYLYSLGNVWVPCECYKRGDKWAWKKWKVDPWTRISNPASEGVKDAWIDGIKDSLPADASPRMIAEKCADQIESELQQKKTTRWLNQTWAKHERIIEGLAKKQPDLHQNLLDAYRACERNISENTE